MCRVRRALPTVSSGPVVAVVGGGVIGLTCARQLAKSGAQVTLYDRPQRGRPSDVAAGMLAPTCELDYGESALHALSVDSLARWPELARSLHAESGVDVELRTNGTLQLATDPDDRLRLERRAQLWDQHALRYEWLTGRECRRHEPALSRRVLAGLRVDSDWSVDNRRVLDALRLSVAAGGVRIVEDLAYPLLADGSVTAVRSGDGVQRVDHLVLAAGVWSGRLAREAGLDPAIRPVKGQQLRLHSPVEILTRTVRARVDEVDVYLVPRADRTVVVGGTSEDVGHDLRRTPRAVIDLLSAACAIVPELRDSELVEHSVGLRPATDDNGPYLGLSQVPGLTLATGHYRHGFLLAPITAEVVRATVLHEPPPASSLPFCTSRRLEKEGAHA
ncbi:glycine oxidase ThiO [Leekyejoonella antrihumi]|uniref:glycine oxidase n=1 Tax=Leekyejoonella antrihumi TaxID=1660198 RepID=A0A563E1F6_9MICO|nr:glycine oxidase ThiO [Leekyejoonella antrihumi]